MGVGVVGLVLWLFVWGPWARNRSTASRQYTSVERDGYSQRPGSPGTQGTYEQEERRYEDQYPN
jgi:hypothetical protein